MTTGQTEYQSIFEMEMQQSKEVVPICVLSLMSRMTVH